VGAWIEMGNVLEKSSVAFVAPLVGAWIEIERLMRNSRIAKSRSPRGSVD